MKKQCLVVLLFACMAALPGVSSAAGLKSVQLKPDCGYVFNSFTGSPPGFDAMSQQLITLLQLAHVKIPVSSWQEADLETFNDKLTGDGIPDYYQLAMLGAALCAGDPVITAQFENNKTEFTNLVSAVRGLLTVVTPLMPVMGPTADAIDTWLATLPPGNLKYDAEYLVWMLQDTDDSMATIVTQYGTIITSALPLYTNWFAAMSGIDSEIQYTIYDLLNQLLDYFASTCPLQPLSKYRFENQKEFLQELLASESPALPAELASQCTTLLNLIDNVLPAYDPIHMPNMVIFGASGKSETEPLSADGDFNGDGLTNKQAYDLVKAANGDRIVFVQAAASNNPFWAGNTALPLVRSTGLAVLATLLCVAAAMHLRKGIVKPAAVQAQKPNREI